jgi:hypothetical protein
LGKSAGGNECEENQQEGWGINLTSYFHKQALFFGSHHASNLRKKGRTEQRPAFFEIKFRK